MFRCVRKPDTDRRWTSQPKATSAASIFASAAAVIASAEATVIQDEVRAADIAAASAWERRPIDLDCIFEREREAWLVGQQAADLTVEHTRVARRSVIAKTLAAEAIASGLTAAEYASSKLMSDRIAAILAVRPSTSAATLRFTQREVESPDGSATIDVPAT